MNYCTVDYNQILYTVLAGVSIWKHCVHRALPQLCQDTRVTTGKQTLVILFLYCFSISFFEIIQ
jgi:hypothetical protein